MIIIGQGLTIWIFFLRCVTKSYSGRYIVSPERSFLNDLRSKVNLLNLGGQNFDSNDFYNSN